MTISISGNPGEFARDSRVSEQKMKKKKKKQDRRSDVPTNVQTIPYIAALLLLWWQNYAGAYCARRCGSKGSSGVGCHAGNKRGTRGNVRVAPLTGKYATCGYDTNLNYVLLGKRKSEEPDRSKRRDRRTESFVRGTNRWQQQSESARARRCVRTICS